MQIWFIVHRLLLIISKSRPKTFRYIGRPCRSRTRAKGFGNLCTSRYTKGLYMNCAAFFDGVLASCLGIILMFFGFVSRWVGVLYYFIFMTLFCQVVYPYIRRGMRQRRGRGRRLLRRPTHWSVGGRISRRGRILGCR